MTETPTEPPSAGDEPTEPPSVGDEHKGARQKTRSRKKAIAFVTILAALVILPILWGVYFAVKLSRAPVTLARPHNYEAALEEVLELQVLALSEAEAGRPAFFVSHVGCAAPPVWQDQAVLENFKRMRAAGVEVTLLGGRKGYQGEPLPSPTWPKEFQEKLMVTLALDQEGVDAFFHLRERELYNHSIVAGSAQRSQAYIASHEETNIYPRTYVVVKDYEACQEWKKNLLTKAQTPDKPTSPPL